jgi:hypothetical protein
LWVQPDWEAIKALRNQEGAFATNSERRSNWAAQNPSTTFWLIMAALLLIAGLLVLCVIYGIRMQRNGPFLGRTLAVDHATAPSGFCKDGGDCENGFGKFVWKSGAYYEGQWFHGRLRHGQGKFVSPPGHAEPAVIEGKFTYGKIQEGYSPFANGGFKSALDDDL